MLGLLNIIVALLICRNILCQPTVFTKQWYKDTNCITYENDILTTLEFILVDLQRLRFDTKQLKDDTTLIKTNLVRMKEDVNHIKTQSKKFIVTLNKFGNKLDITEVNKADMKDVLLELNKTVVRILNPMPCDITTPPPNLSTEINNTPAIRHENEIPNEIIVEPTTIKESDNDSMYFEKTENEIKNNVVRLPGAPGHDFKGVEDKINVVGGKESGKHYDKEEYDIEIESFSGEGGIVYAGSGRSGFDEERPETIAFQSDHINATFETNAKEKIASDSPKLNETVRHVGLGYNTISADAKGFDLPELGDATSGEDIFTDCSDAPSTTPGIYIIAPSGSDQSFPVYCQLQDNDHWLVFQRRLNGEVDFYRNWTDYKNGFGQLDGEFWLGNEKLHLITAQNKYMLRIDMWDWAVTGEGFGRHIYADSNYFYVDGETEFYRLHVPLGFYDYSGFGGSGLRVHAGPFMTYDKRHTDMRNNCAMMFHTGWWFKTCVRNANLNGKYYPGGYVVPENHTRAIDGIFWRNIPRSLKKVEMKLKRITTKKSNGTR